MFYNEKTMEAAAIWKLIKIFLSKHAMAAAERTVAKIFNKEECVVALIRFNFV